MNDMIQKIDRLAQIKAKQSILKKEADVLEAELLKVAQEDLANTKYKSVTYKGTSSKLQATLSDTVKITLESLLPSIFGAVYGDMVKISTKYELTAPAKRLIVGIWQGDYVKNSSIDEVIKSMSLDSKTEKLVSKKCKGINYQKDVDNLIAIVGMTELEAQEYAYLLMESAIWQQFDSICKVNNLSDTAISELLDKVQSAFVVEVTPKISITEV